VLLVDVHLLSTFFLNVLSGSRVTDGCSVLFFFVVVNFGWSLNSL
jgi:hypothetical protein